MFLFDRFSACTSCLTFFLIKLCLNILLDIWCDELTYMNNVLVQVFNPSVFDNMLAKIALSSVSIGLFIVLLQLCIEFPNEAGRGSSFVFSEGRQRNIGVSASVD